MHELQHSEMETGAMPTQLPSGICYVTAKRRFRVKLRRQKKDYYWGHYRTKTEALVALAELKRILKGTRKLRPGPKG